jgi:hypothetical protein
MAFNRIESDRIQDEEIFKLSLGSSSFHVVSFSGKKEKRKRKKKEEKKKKTTKRLII